jgi:hypothetical protein
MEIDMRTLVLVGRLKPKLGGCRRLRVTLLPMLTQNERLMNGGHAVSSGRHWVHLISTLVQANVCQFACDGGNLCWTVAELVHTVHQVGRPGLVSLAFQPPTTNH